MKDYWDRILENINAIPPKDIEPVKRGKWIPYGEKSREHGEYDSWFCNTCGYRIKNGQPMYNFCPNCRAKMEPISASTENGQEVEA